ncbi:MAG: DUF6683 family protein [Cyanobacteria bacterium J06554_3]
MAATVMAATVLGYATRAHSQYMSMFNAYGSAAVNIAGTMSVNAAIGRSADIAADRNTSSSPQPTSDSDWVAPSPSNAPYSPISYSIDPAIRAEVIASYVERIRQTDTAAGNEIEQLFRDRDLIGETAQNFQAYGLDINDLGDVITAYWAINWGAVNQSGRPSVDQVQGLRSQFRSILAGSPITQTTTAAERQQIADDMLVKLILVDGGVEQSLREGNTAELQNISRLVQQSNLASMGIDLAALDLTAQGLTLR